jgi:hypothetical protein
MIIPLFRDTFTGTAGTSLLLHTPDLDVAGGGWESGFYAGDLILDGAGGLVAATLAINCDGRIVGVLPSSHAVEIDFTVASVTTFAGIYYVLAKTTATPQWGVMNVVTTPGGGYTIGVGTGLGTPGTIYTGSGFTLGVMHTLRIVNTAGSIEIFFDGVSKATRPFDTTPAGFAYNPTIMDYKTSGNAMTFNEIRIEKTVTAFWENRVLTTETD